MTYQQKKAIVRDAAIAWQLDFENYDYSLGELAEIQTHFEKLGRRYGLVCEFRENGII